MKYESKLPDINKLQAQISAHRPLDSYELKQLKEYYRIGPVQQRPLLVTDI